MLRKADPLGDFPSLPYPVLGPYTDPRLFAGRERELGELLARLRESPPILGVFGTSGAGKTSLLRAGLLPALAASGVPAAYTGHPAEGGLARALLSQILSTPPQSADLAGFVAALERARTAAGEAPVLRRCDRAGVLPHGRHSRW